MEATEHVNRSWFGVSLGSTCWKLHFSVGSCRKKLFISNNHKLFLSSFPICLYLRSSVLFLVVLPALGLPVMKLDHWIILAERVY